MDSGEAGSQGTSYLRRCERSGEPNLPEVVEQGEGQGRGGEVTVGATADGSGAVVHGDGGAVLRDANVGDDAPHCA